MPGGAGDQVTVGSCARGVTPGWEKGSSFRLKCQEENLRFAKISRGGWRDGGVRRQPGPGSRVDRHD